MRGGSDWPHRASIPVGRRLSRPPVLACILNPAIIMAIAASGRDTCSGLHARNVIFASDRTGGSRSVVLGLSERLRGA